MYMQNNFKEEQSLVIASLSTEKLLWMMSQIFEIKLTTLSLLDPTSSQQDIKDFMDSMPLMQENQKIMMIKTYQVDSIFKCYQNMFIDMIKEMDKYSPTLLKQHITHYLSHFSNKENRILLKRIEAISI